MSAAGPATGGVEVELKLRVRDLADLVRIAQAAGAPPEATARQTNTFFDTSGRALDAARFVVRLRQEEVAGAAPHFFVTAKGPRARTADGALSGGAEEEVEIGGSAAAALLAGGDPLTHLVSEPGSGRAALIDAIRSAAAGAPLRAVGKFVNERTRVAFSPTIGGAVIALVLELDRTTFPGEQVHHEVELEIPGSVSSDEVSRAFTELFRRADVVGKPAAGKASRFFAAQRGERLDP